MLMLLKRKATLSVSHSLQIENRPAWSSLALARVAVVACMVWVAAWRLKLSFVVRITFISDAAVRGGIAAHGG
ncbi:hypothetical protein ACVWYQ_003559 [Bradyrhizobium sp. USDA 3397]